MSNFLGLPKVQYFDSNGDPLNGGKLHTYEPGTTSNKASYPTIADAQAGTNANANPVILDSRGEANVVLAGNTKLVLKDSDDNTIWTVDNVNDDATLFDANGNEMLEFTATASAVNHIGLVNAATGDSPKIQAEGEADTGIIFANKDGEEILILDSIASSVNELTIKSAATGNNPSIEATGEADTGITFANSESEEILILDSIASSVNQLTVKSSATGTSPSIEATGDDTNIGLDFKVKGTGVYNLFATDQNSTKLRLYEDSDNGTNYIEVTPTSSLTSNRSITLPDSSLDLTAGAFSAYTTTGASCSDATATKVQLDTELFDEESWFDSTTNYRYTPQVAGEYLITAGSGFGTMNAAGAVILLLYKNGSEVARTQLFTHTNNETYVLNLSAIVNMNGSTDYLELFIFQNGGATETHLTGSNQSFMHGQHLV